MDGETFRRKLRELAIAKFPAKGNGEPTQARLMGRLRELWLSIVARYSEEAYGLSADQFRFLVDFQASAEDAKFDLEQFPGWLERCKGEFLERTKFTKIRVIPPQKRWKHWLKTEATERDVEEKSESAGESLFYWPVEPSMVEGWLWMCMGEFFDAFMARDPRYYYLKANRAIGASGGEPVEYICLDVDFAAGEAHAYPIPASGVRDAKYLLDMAAHGIEIRPAGSA